jgi:L-malate glycosyltransferase
MNSLHNKKILIVCPYPRDTGAGQRLKYEQYISDWEYCGAKVTIDNFFVEKAWPILHKKGQVIRKIFFTLLGYLRRIITLVNVPQHDYVYIHMWGTPIGPPIYETVLRIISKKVIYDLEDSIINSEDERKSALRKILKTKSKIRYLIKSSNYVIASSPALALYCRKLNIYGCAKYITSSVDVGKFRKIKDNSLCNKISIGWTGTVSTFPYFLLIRDILIEMKKVYDFRLVIIGNFNYQDEELDLELIQWSSDTEIEDLSRIDIGLYPLPDNDWVSGKSGLKAIQYQAMGIPFVASNVGNTPNVVEHERTGFLASNENDWKHYLALLLSDPHLRDEMGKNGIAKAHDHFSTLVVKHQYRSIF